MDTAVRRCQGWWYSPDLTKQTQPTTYSTFSPCNARSRVYLTLSTLNCSKETRRSNFTLACPSTMRDLCYRLPPTVWTEVQIIMCFCSQQLGAFSQWGCAVGTWRRGDSNSGSEPWIDLVSGLEVCLGTSSKRRGINAQPKSQSFFAFSAFNHPTVSVVGWTRKPLSLLLLVYLASRVRTT